MRILAFLIFLLFVRDRVDAQNVTLDDLIQLRSKSITDVEEFLVGKNWQLIEVKEPNDSTLGSATFAFEKSDYEDRATSFISYYYSGVPAIQNRISIQLSKTLVYNSFMSRLKLIGYKFRSSQIEGGELLKTYENDSSVLRVKVKVEKEDLATKTSYTISVWDLMGYFIQFGFK